MRVTFTGAAPPSVDGLLLQALAERVSGAVKPHRGHHPCRLATQGEGILPRVLVVPPFAGGSAIVRIAAKAPSILIQDVILLERR